MTIIANKNAPLYKRRIPYRGSSWKDVGKDGFGNGIATSRNHMIPTVFFLPPL